MFQVIDILQNATEFLFHFPYLGKAPIHAEFFILFLHPLNISFEESLNDFLFFHSLFFVQL